MQISLPAKLARRGRGGLLCVPAMDRTRRTWHLKARAAHIVAAQITTDYRC